MASRLMLHDELCKILGSLNVYFQPPENIKLKYPCILYTLSGNDVKHADNTKYNRINQYSVTLIDKNPESEFHDKINKLPYCRFDRPYSADGLNHFTYTLYY